MNTSSSRPKKGDRIDFILQLWFFVLVIGSIVAFFACRSTYPLLFQSLGMAAIVIRVIYYVKLLLLSRRDDKRK